MTIKELNEKYQRDKRPIKVRKAQLIGWGGKE